MTESDRTNKQEVLQYIRANPFISQRELAQHLQISRSTVAAYIASLIKEGEIVGRAYVLPETQRILCIGGANVDRKIHSKEAIQLGTSNPSVVMETHGGVARNIAENLARLGVPPTLLTMIGEDKEGEMLLHHMASLGADISTVIRSPLHRTGTYTAVLNVDGSMVVACADMDIYEDFTIERLDPRTKVLAQSSLVIVDTNLPAKSLDYIIGKSAELETPLIVAPVSSPKARRLPHHLVGVHVLIANLDEIETISGMTIDTMDDVPRACEILQQRGCRQIVVTLGKDGVLWMDESGVWDKIPADSVDVVDVTGAGDAFVAGFAYATSQSLSVKKSCQFASRLSRLTLQAKETVSSAITPHLAHTWLTDIHSELEETK